ncbi:uncharacterized protein BDR25DRAFT_351827 [Lindgomyces ingoldianus]|uniref:Uncharacterized protein n=1 Tax=Lindgomyces ingoldianus TaxID=673940 RepID=A0ACB6R4T5_9PLEO|nr:uncharacterized protein BDR25DRAFT_351827 [Lindgomyces ingoldianus]KAF2474269.1 hypothetical protein BDR25DRAFT_351827 [Lindgomyces ingoldianus]
MGVHHRLLQSKQLLENSNGPRQTEAIQQVLSAYSFLISSAVPDVLHIPPIARSIIASALWSHFTFHSQPRLNEHSMWSHIKATSLLSNMFGYVSTIFLHGEEITFTYDRRPSGSIPKALCNTLEILHLPHTTDIGSKHNFCIFAACCAFSLKAKWQLHCAALSDLIILLLTQVHPKDGILDLYAGSTSPARSLATSTSARLQEQLLAFRFTDGQVPLSPGIHPSQTQIQLSFLHQAEAGHWMAQSSCKSLHNLTISPYLFFDAWNPQYYASPLYAKPALAARLRSQREEFKTLGAELFTFVHQRGSERLGRAEPESVGWALAIYLSILIEFKQEKAACDTPFLNP